MSPYRRNVLVGVTVMGALCVLGWMILKFGGSVARPFAPPSIPVVFETDRADGVADGSAINYLGVETGHVTEVEIDPQSRQRVVIRAVINTDPPLPANVRGVIKTSSLLGSGANIALVTDGPPSNEKLARNQKIQARFVGYAELLPPEFSQLASELAATAKQFRDSNLVADLDAQVKNAGRVIDSMQQILGDPKTQEDLKASLANMRAVTESAKTLAAKLDKFADDLQKTNVEANAAIGDARAQITRAGNNVESLSRQMGERLTQIAKLLDQFQSVAEKIDKGQGSAGALVNDPRLYESLLDTSRELNATIKDFKRLVEQWEQEGVSFKLK
jgi:phospholipid/cholesterol/gamma-HCH transport system substrate-binding protein